MDALTDVRQFCTRQPDACVVDSEAIVAFGQKTQASAKVIYETITTQRNEASMGAGNSNRAKKASQDTLSIIDRAEPWVGPKMTRRKTPER